ncbi:metallophosphoesterase family protein [Sulfitobacter mediterraneus]|uniref:metallophosphoesterase family protein n=1 Tax=Sulfitobacter mediterraneus TaxID=83219 RepID=UPI0021A86619|nr:DNA repair exonuclease [Sulfitobacter mediterraneus]UWR10919.1 DNA repair exonuclease [Sulfitobacter mediterraneus]
MIKILHTADIHLDSPLKSLALKYDDLRTTIQTATRTAFTRIVDTALFEDVSALLISGDLFDGSERSAKTAAFLTTQLDRLKAASIPVFYIKGNHDAENPITGEVNFPENVHVFDGHGGRVQIGNLGVWVHGVSFSGRHAPESLLRKFGAPEPDAINIAMLHTSLAGSEGHDIYAPCSLSELTVMGFDYWALGHIHKRKVHSNAPWIVMPGIPQGRDIGEAGAKSATLITIENNKDISVSEVLTSAAEFIDAKLALDGFKTDDELRRAIHTVIQDSAANLTSDAGLLRLTLIGNSPRRWQILRDQDNWCEIVAELAQGTGKIWVEKVRFDLQPGTRDTDTDAPAVAELGHLMREVQAELGFRSELAVSFEAILAEIPKERRARLAPDEEAAAALVKRLSDTGAETILAAMKGTVE